MARHSLWYLVSYDVRDPVRLRRVFKLLKGYGRPLQYSLFRVKGTMVQVERMRWELERILEKEDDLLIVPLCERCSERVRSRNPKGAWPDDEPSFKIVGSE